jgi:hypothetical protein
MPVIPNLSREQLCDHPIAVVGHHYILSPLDEPWAYLAFILHWVSCLVCVFVGIYFYRQKKGTWWLLIALAFALPLLENIVTNFWLGLPPLPYGTAYPDLVSSAPPGYAGNIIKRQEVDIRLDSVAPIMALALGWAYFSDRKARAATR